MKVAKSKLEWKIENIKAESKSVASGAKVIGEIKSDAKIVSEVLEIQDGEGENDVMNTPPMRFKTEAQELHVRTVQCSICGETLTIPDGWKEDSDSFLSQHMNQCQTDEQYSRSTRRSRRKTKKPISYKDDNGDTDAPSRQSEKRKLVVKGHVEDEFIGDIESSDDEKLMDQKISKKEVEDISESADNDAVYARNKAVDDFDVYDYEDRIDEWIESGVQSMNVMDEQDDDDERPGAITYVGGLEIPAWVNDRLFGYQRTALRWMWELHMQEAGGIVGDEMVWKATSFGSASRYCLY